MGEEFTMDEKKNKEQRKEDEIDLRELFLVLWNKKVMILCIALIAAILSGVYSVLVLTPVYHSKLNIVINMPENYNTKYGDYALPITTNEQYINLITSSDILAHTIVDMGYDPANTTIESIRDRITIIMPDIKANTEQNSFKVQVAADNPTEAQRLAKTLFDNYKEFLDVLTVEGAMDFYSNKYNIALASLNDSLITTREILAKNEELLEVTPQTINQRDAMQEIQDTANTSDYIVLENVINPNYTKIENDIIENKQSINSIENSMRVYNEYLAEIDVKKNSVAIYRESGNFDELKAEIVSVTKTNVYLPSDPIVPSRKTSPSNSRNVIIGTLLGGMVGALAALIKVYWIKSK